MPNHYVKGFTLVELIVAMGLFAFVMSISTGAYLMMIAANREAQATATGINNLSYTLESVTRNIRTGKRYDTDCSPSSPVSEFTFDRYDQDGQVDSVTYKKKADNRIYEEVGSNSVAITDPTVAITRLDFYCSGVVRSASDPIQANVTVVVEGTVSAGPNRQRKFNVQTTATMRGIDL